MQNYREKLLLALAVSAREAKTAVVYPPLPPSPSSPPFPFPLRSPSTSKGVSGTALAELAGWLARAAALRPSMV